MLAERWLRTCPSKEATLRPRKQSPDARPATIDRPQRPLKRATFFACIGITVACATTLLVLALRGVSTEEFGYVPHLLILLVVAIFIVASLAITEIIPWRSRSLREWARPKVLGSFVGLLMGALGLAAGLTPIFNPPTATEKTVENIQQAVGDVQATMKAACRYPPCWTAEQAQRELLGSTKDHVDGKVGTPSLRTASGWHYKVGGCPVVVHFVNDVAAYFSHPISPECPSSWMDVFAITGPMLPSGQLTIGQMLDALFSDAYPPELHIATGCTNCGNWHEPYIEFRVPGPRASGFFDRYFFTWFEGGDGAASEFERRLTADYSLNASGTMTDFCGVDVRKSVENSLRNITVSHVGYGTRGWYGRQNYPIDICHEGYVAGPP